MNDPKISRHRKLATTFNDLVGLSALPVLHEELNSDQVKDIDPKSINYAVVAFTDLLAIDGLSEGNINLYTLLKAYLTKPECRAEINHLALHALVKSKITKPA